MDEKNTGSTEGTEEIIASDGTPEVIDVESTTETAVANVTETATQEVTATDGAQEEVAVTATEPVAVEATATTVTVQDAPEADQPPAPDAGTTQPAPSAGAPVPPPPPTGAAVGSAAPSATGALVCGILAIVLSGFPIFGVILGIIAIVLAGKYFKSGGTQGTGKAARICGIIGIVLAIVWFIAGVVLSIMALDLADSYSSSSSSSSSSSLSSSAAATADESEAAVEAVTMRLQQIKDRDPEMIASITAMAEESFENEFAYLGVGATMSNCGIDPNKYMDLMLKDFDYEFMSFDMGSTSSKTKGTATFILTSMDILEMTDNLSEAVDKINDEGGLSGSDAQQRQQIGNLVMSALRDTGVSHYNFFEVKMVNQDGVWVIDEDSWDEEIEYFFTLS